MENKDIKKTALKKKKTGTKTNTKKHLKNKPQHKHNTLDL